MHRMHVCVRRVSGVSNGLALGAYLGLGLPGLAVLHLDLDGVDLLQLVQYLVEQVRGVVDQHVHKLQE